MLEYLEIIALITGLLVIIIETVIIILLYQHQRALNEHLLRSEKLTKALEEKIEKHLEHLNEHSHEIEEKLETICRIKPSSSSISQSPKPQTRKQRTLQE